MAGTPQLSFSAKLYQERRIPEDRPTRRRPGSRLQPRMNVVHDLPLDPPLPDPDVVYQETLGVTPAGLTTPWVHGAKEQV
jgi:hypothetical protein